MEKTPNTIPAPFATSPGIILKAELKERGLKQGEFAASVGMRPSHFSEVLKGTRPINDQLALKLEEELDIPAETWLKLQALFTRQQKEAELLSIEEQEAINELHAYNEVIDVKTLVKHFDLHYYTKSVQRQFFRGDLQLPPPAELQVKSAGFYRRSAKVGKDDRMIYTWALMAKHAVKDIVPQGEYKPEKIDELAKVLSATFHSNQNTIEKVTEILSQYGIKFAIVEKIDKASIDGISFKSNGVPAIVITCRIKKIDNIAFVILHELGHHKMHIKDDNLTFISYEGYEESMQENEADEFATEALIPANIWNTLPVMPVNNVFLLQKECTKWANLNNLNKWIVLGRLSHELGIYKFKSDGSRDIK